MGVIGFIGKVIIFPFKLIFTGGKKKEPTAEEAALINPPTEQLQTYPTGVASDNLKAKVDLMLAQVDSLKIEYDAINQRIQSIERMVRELYTMAKS